MPPVFGSQLEQVGLIDKFLVFLWFPVNWFNKRKKEWMNEWTIDCGKLFQTGATRCTKKFLR